MARSAIDHCENKYIDFYKQTNYICIKKFPDLPISPKYGFLVQQPQTCDMM